jgi:hypothetical protein
MSGILKASLAVDGNTKRILSSGGQEQFMKDLVQLLASMTNTPGGNIHIMEFSLDGANITFTAAGIESATLQSMFDVYNGPFDFAKYKKLASGMAIGIVMFTPHFAM